MCGIIGYIGKNNAINILIKGLKSLEYRGYDSCGIAYYDKKIKIIKAEGKIINLENKINPEIISHVGIGHTRWATHGKPNETNAHPHHIGKTTIVHNGIIENYIELKKDLSKKYHFKSETDTEVACALIDLIYTKEKDAIKTLNQVKKLLKGSYALEIIFDDQPETIYAIRKDSPLIIAKNDQEFFIASDITALLEYTNKYYLLEENETAIITKEKILIIDSKQNIVHKKINTYDGDKNSVMKNGYKHFMLKEINDEPDVIRSIIKTYVPNYDILELEKNFGQYGKYQKITIVGCGSAYHSGVVIKYLMEELANIKVDIELASEYRYKKIFYEKNELTILISQSGETADTIEALNKAKNNKCDTLGIINVPASKIARESKKTIYVKAGNEIAVATTKAYVAQVFILSLLTILLSYQRKIITKEEANKYLLSLKNFDKLVKKTIDNCEQYHQIAKNIYQENYMFFIGRKIDYALAMEASLKMKEISYIHSEAYAAGELKHGTISLIENNTIVLGIVTDEDIASKTISNLKETKSRGSKIILITTNKLKKKITDKFYDEIIIIDDTNNYFQSILTIIPLQLLSYYVALEKKEDIDQPRNLAKSVTVE